MRASPGGGVLYVGHSGVAAVPWHPLCRASRPLPIQEQPLYEETVTQ
jgi:hypothetical protein